MSQRFCEKKNLFSTTTDAQLDPDAMTLHTAVACHTVDFSGRNGD
jgi:hypothetical protein